jgi:hypothetical protein
MEIRVAKPFDAGRSLGELRIMYADRLHAARSFAMAAVLVGAGGAALLLAFSGMSGLVVVLLVVAAVGVYFGVGSPRALRRGVSELPDVIRCESVIVVTEDRIVQEYPMVRNEVLWSAITRVVETNNGWLLAYGPRHAISLPKDGLNEVQAAQFRGFLATRTAHENAGGR